MLQPHPIVEANKLESQTLNERIGDEALFKNEDR